MKHASKLPAELVKWLEGIEYKDETGEVSSSGKLITWWNDEWAVDCPEDLNWHRNIGELVKETAGNAVRACFELLATSGGEFEADKIERLVAVSFGDTKTDEEIDWLKQWLVGIVQHQHSQLTASFRAREMKMKELKGGIE